MFGLYLASAIIGWAFVGLFLFGGIDSDVAADFDPDIDLDSDLDGDAELAEGGFASSVASAALSLLSFRSIVFFLAFFGLTGTALNLIEAGPAATLVAAIGVGWFAWVFNSLVFRALKVADVSSSLQEADLRGAMGEVVLPMSQGQRGRIVVEVGDQRRYLTAEPFDADGQGKFGPGDPIVVIEIDKGTAKVAPIEM